MYFDEEDLRDKTYTMNINPFIKLYTSEEKNSDEFVFLSACIHCQKVDNYPLQTLTFGKKLSQKYGCNAKRFTFFQGDPYKLNKVEKVQFDQNFTQKLPELKNIICVNHQIEFENSNNFFENLPKLTHVDLENNNLNHFPESIFKLENIKHIRLAHNSIKSFAQDLNNLNKLQHLRRLELDQVGYEKLGDTLPVNLPAKLGAIILKSFPFDELPFDFSKCAKSLTELVITGVEWIDVESYGNNPIFTLEQLLFRYAKFLGEENVKKLFHHFDTKRRAYLDNEEISLFNAFIYKKFPRFKDLKTNKFISKIFQFENLKILDFSFQGILSIPDEIDQLKNLETLILNNCILLGDISPKLSNCTKMNRVDVSNCISIKTPPSEICQRGSVAILAYLKRLLTGSMLYKRTKLMLVGLGEAGKTSLVNSLMIRSSKHNRPQITDGIDIRDWSVDLPDETSLTFSIWDFGKFLFDFKFFLIFF